MNNLEKLSNYIDEFQNEIENWLLEGNRAGSRISWLNRKTRFFKHFFEHELENLDETKIENLTQEIHSLSSMGRARYRATNFDKNSMADFKRTFTYLAQPIRSENKYNEIETRLKNILSSKGSYKLYGWGIGAVSELIGYIHSESFIFFNSRERTVADYLNLEYKDNGYPWKQYRSFQEKVVQPFLQLYQKPDLTIVKDIPKGLLIDQFFSWIYETKVKNKEVDIGDATPVIRGKLESVTIQNYYGIKNVSLPKLSNEVYIIGENGAGKTLLLQAIFWVVQHLLIENDPENTLGTAWIKRNFSKLKNLKIKLETNEVEDNIYQYPYSEEGNGKNKRIKNFFAYGVNRQYQKGNEDTYEFMSLFNSEVQTSLRNPMDWLKDIKLKELEAKDEGKIYNGITLNQAITFLEELLDNNVTINVSSKGVTFTEGKGEPLDFYLLSDGYKSVFTWVADLLSRLAENQPVNHIKDFKGVVLIDELDLFLHPKWSYNIVKQLTRKDKLPNIQFIITTHSPMLILGAGKKAIFYRMYKEEGVSNILGPIENESLRDKMANQIITAPFLFDLPTARQASFDEKNGELDTSDDYLYSVIHEAIEKRLEKELKSNLTEKNIWKIVNELLDDELNKR